jgi:hypothetical protein
LFGVRPLYYQCDGFSLIQDQGGSDVGAADPETSSRVFFGRRNEESTTGDCKFALCELFRFKQTFIVM